MVVKLPYKTMALPPELGISEMFGIMNKTLTLVQHQNSGALQPLFPEGDAPVGTWHRRNLRIGKQITRVSHYLKYQAFKGTFQKFLFIWTYLYFSGINQGQQWLVIRNLYFFLSNCTYEILDRHQHQQTHGSNSHAFFCSVASPFLFMAEFFFIYMNCSCLSLFRPIKDFSNRIKCFGTFKLFLDGHQIDLPRTFYSLIVMRAC